jgi:hypothetical protein
MEITNHNGYTLSQENRNETLFNLLKDPPAFYGTSKVPTALDIAETLTLCWLQLEKFQVSITAQSPDVRLEVIQILNSIGTELLRLYEQLRTLPSEDNLDKLVKDYIFSHLLTSPKEISEDSLDFLNLQLDETYTMKQAVDGIIININNAREICRAKTIPISHDEPEEPSQAKLPGSLELDSLPQEAVPTVVVTKVKIDEVVTLDEHDSLKSPKPTPVIHDEQDKRSFSHIHETDIAPTITPHECTESIVKEAQNHAEHTIRQAERDFLRELKNLQTMIDTTAIEEQQFASSLSPNVSSMTLKQQRARKAALYEANGVLKELHKQVPLTENGERLQSPHHDETLLIRLADICSHTAQGIHFVVGNGATFSCDIFYATSNTSGTIRQVNYDINMHKSGMEHLSEMASSLKGSGWKKLRNALIVLAGLIVCGILAAIPTGGTGLLVVGLGGAAVLTAGIGFFVGRDTGLAGAVSNVQMKVSP